VPADSNDIAAEYQTLLGELEKFNPDLLKKNRLLAISKSDMLDEELKQAIHDEIRDLNPLFFSSIAQMGLVELKDALWKSMDEATVW
jgi:GTP-binding protein